MHVRGVISSLPFSWTQLHDNSYSPQQQETTTTMPLSSLLPSIAWAMVLSGTIFAGVVGETEIDANRSSAVVQVNSTHREGYLMVLLPSSRELEEDRVMYEFRVYVQVSVFLALRHVQQRSGAVLPFLPERLEFCDFDFKYQFHDTQFSPLQAGKHVYHENVYGMERNEERGCGGSTGPDHYPSFAADPINATPAEIQASQTSEHTDTNQRLLQQSQATYQNSNVIRPFAALGAARSAVSQVISALGYAFQLPQISPISTSTALDYAPFFARTVPTSDGESMATMAYLDSLDVESVAIFYLKDEWGSYYRRNVEAAARTYNISVESVPYLESDIEGSLNLLKSTNLRFICGILSPSNWKPVVKLAYDSNMIGNPSFQWFFGSIGALTAERFTLDATTEWAIAQAIHGAGIVSSTPVENEFQAAHDEAMQEFAQSKALQQEFACLGQAEPDIFEDFEFLPPGRALFHFLAYDAAVALALTACDTPGLFTGEEFYDQLLRIDFEGVSGKVQLHNKTGTRLRETLRYRIGNIVMDYDKITEGKDTNLEKIPMVSVATVLVDVPPETSAEAAIVTVVQPWIYNNNGTAPPLALPTLKEEMNLISDGFLYVGYTLAAATMLVSLGWAGWAYYNRNRYVVKVRQDPYEVKCEVRLYFLLSHTFERRPNRYSFFNCVWEPS